MSALIIAETCPAVRELSDNCALMDEFKLTVDDEARNLCNRHQLCYSCVSIPKYVYGYLHLVCYSCVSIHKCVYGYLQSVCLTPV